MSSYLFRDRVPWIRRPAPCATLSSIRSARLSRNVQAILEAAGSSLDGVVKVNAYVTDLTRFAEFNEVYKEFFRTDPPARTTVATSLLGMLVEVDCVATLE